MGDLCPILHLDKSKGVSEFLTPTQHFSAISWREQVNFQLDDDEIRFVLDQHDELDFYSARSLKQQSADRQFAPLGLITVALSP